ncbi:MAG: DUF305 domain-containing protein [Nodosilinea sp.]
MLKVEHLLFWRRPKAAASQSDRPEVRQVAQTIVDTQQAEIDQMKQWRQEWYGQQFCL